MTKPRLRFAPSPTGYLHIGGARTALYNWLWARKTGGVFVLRVEDTDQERSTPESLRAILDSMRWLGLDWDEGPEVGGAHGPYTQMERLAIYAEHASRLVREGSAYRCYATKEEIDAEKARQLAGGAKAYRYPGWWRDKTEKDWPSDRPYVIRLKVPEGGTTGWDDRVKGRIDFPNTELQDQVLMRSDGIPLYNFGCVVDDLTMNITLIARGDDHMINTPIQLLIYRALNAEVPQLAHLPMIFGHDGKKMSKRHGEVSVEAYRLQGLLPDGLLNYLARVGWSHGDQEIFTRAELIEAFSFEGCGREGGKWDPKKLAYVQAEHLRALPAKSIADHARPFAEARGLDVGDEARLMAAADIVRQRATTLLDVADMVDYFFRDPPVFDEKAVQKFLVKDVTANLRSFRDLAASVPEFDRAALEKAVDAWMAERKITFKEYAQAVRVAMSGRSATPGLYEVMEVLGRELVVRRLDAALSRIG